MGRSSFFLRIIACGRDPEDGSGNKSNLRVSEVRSARDKPGWSFRKKLGQSRGIGNSVIIERASYGHNESSDKSAIFSSQCIEESNVSGKACLTQCKDDKEHQVASMESLATAEADENVHESAVIVIQAAVRRILAREKLLKLKDVVRRRQLERDKRETEEPFASTLDPGERQKSQNFENSPEVSLNFSPGSTVTNVENGSLMPSETEENLITYEGEKINFHPYRITTSIADDHANETSNEIHPLSSNPKMNHFDDELKVSKQLGNGSEATLIPSASNIEELSPTMNSTKYSYNFLNMDNGLSNVNSTKEGKSLRYAASECGTELSISSTLDSPDRSEAGVTLDEQGKEVETKVTETYCDAGKFSEKAGEVLSESTRLSEDHLKNLNHAKEESDGSIVLIDVSQIKQKLKRGLLDDEEERSFQEKPPPSQQASSRSQELLKTPSSNVSTKLKRDKPGRRGPHKKGISPPNHNYEQSHKDTSGKKRDSFGSDQERRKSTSSISVPRFMQATESARAKLLGNNGSPKSCPDMQEQDIYIMKRHSLPGANVKQVSPRIQTSKKEREWQR